MSHGDCRDADDRVRVSTRFQLGGYQGQQLWRSVAAGLITAVRVLALVLTPLGTTFEHTFGLDWLFKMRGTTAPPPAVAVVGINSGTRADVATSLPSSRSFSV